jgi:hypothetical protein
MLERKVYHAYDKDLMVKIKAGTRAIVVYTGKGTDDNPTSESIVDCMISMYKKLDTDHKMQLLAKLYTI